MAFPKIKLDFVLNISRRSKRYQISVAINFRSPIDVKFNYQVSDSKSDESEKDETN